MALNWPEKDPDDILDYGFAVKGFDEGDQIETSAIEVTQGGIQIVSHGIVPGTTETTTRLSGGTAGETASVRIRTTMTSGQRVDQTINIPIAER